MPKASNNAIIGPIITKMTTLVYIEGLTMTKTGRDA